MTLVNHLKGQNPESKQLVIAFGRHIADGELTKSKLSGGVVTVQHILGDALGYGWKGIFGAWFRGVNRDETKYKFYPGKLSSGNSDPVQGVDSVFDQDTPHSGLAWVRLETPSGTETGIPDSDIKNNPPIGASFILDCQTGDIYDEFGDVEENDMLLTNPADVLGFASKVIRGYDTSRIDWEVLAALRSFCDELITPDYTTLPQGVGLTSKYFDGDNFETLVRSRIDPIIEFPLSSGAPELGIDPANYSVRIEGKVRAKYSETYTFQVVHNDGAKLWVDNTLLIDEWGTTGTHTGTIDLNADEYYEIKLEVKNSSGDSQFSLQWSSASQPLQTIPQDRLYPKDEPLEKFECHLAFLEPPTLDEFFRQVLFTCNGAYQEANGKLKFFSIDNLSTSFDFDETNIVKNTFSFKPRYTQQELLDLPNRFIAAGRDIESRYIKPFDPVVVYEIPELQELAGKVNEETVNVGNTRRWQALENLKHYAKLRVSNLVAEFEGMPETLQVLNGDLVSLSHSISGWSNRRFLVLEATDKSIDRGPDTRFFRILDWPSDMAEVVTVGGVNVTIGGEDVTVGG